MGELKKRPVGIVPQQRIERHQYTDLIVQLCVEIYMKAHIGFDSVVVIISLLNSLLLWNLKRIPCANTVENRVKKSGYGIYHNSGCPAPEKEYAVTADESMMPGSEKMMPVLGVDADKANETALTRGDIGILNIAADSSWNSAGIKDDICSKISANCPIPKPAGMPQAIL
jgi:hypothetical protein